MTFSSSIAAFGFYGTDIGDFGATLTLNLVGGGNAVLNVGNTTGSGGSTNGSLLFYGFISQNAAHDIMGITFEASNTSDFFGFDDMIVASREQIIPLPTGAAMAMVGIGAIGLRRKRV
ncbi:MAG: hypothetical protein IID31_13805 [Planctomycetes bacterium]|nr:hypothetical protein [Planctomycetota bacterium]